MGCFSCFDSKEEEHLNPVGRQEKPKVVQSNRVLRVSSEFNRAKERNAIQSRKESLSPNDPNNGVNAKIAAQVFTFQELAAATKNFDPECFLGGGGFGRVYKGFLESTGQVVAVKQLDRNGLQGNREFLVEVLMLNLVDHPNLVNLIGYCADGDQRLLVYEYMPLGSLEDHLHHLKDKEPLDWNRRMKIAAGAAKGLEYLHDKIKPPVIYRDFKSSNILLGEGFHPKLSDFGLAKLGPLGDKSHVSTRVMGTYGYCAPEYAMTGQLTIKSDVYSFGVFFLELITGRKAIDGTKPAAEQNLVKWARPMLNDRRKYSEMADPRLNGQYPHRGLYQALAVASMCLQEQATTRPLIADVVTALSYLASQTFDPYKTPPRKIRVNSEVDEKRSRHASSDGHENMTERKAKYGEDNESGFNWDLDRCNKDDLLKETARILGLDSGRERAVAEAKMWGENLREKRRAGTLGGN